MWRSHATPRRIVALNGSAPRSPIAAAVAAPERRDAARCGDPVAPNGQVRRVEFAVAAGVHAPAMARAAVAPWLSERVSDQLRADTQLLLSELVTNSVRHAHLTRGAAIRVSVEISDGFVHLEVEDPGDDSVITSRRPDRERGGGFGLYLVETLAKSWGSRHEGSTCVWAELAISSGS
jgi:anti-sigma regulatory factor (Ser/Thr protein kinase)